MPIAQVSTDTIRYDLKTCTGGYVVLRPLTYGQKLKRNSFVQIELGGKNNPDKVAKIDTATSKVALFELSTCVVEHNLEKSDGSPFNFSNVMDVNLLDPRVGEEIDKLINSLNNYEEDEGN